MRSVTIDELLTWAFVHELPKGGGVEGLDSVHSAWRMLEASSWGKIMRFGQYMTLIDAGRSDPENFMLEQGEPHEDALVVGEAVAGLASCEILVPEDWQPLCDWPQDDARMPELVAKATARSIEAFFHRAPAARAAHLVSLVIGTAILGKEPAWDAPVSAISMIERMGRPAWFAKRVMRDASSGCDYEVETDGYNQRTGRPVRGAYRKFCLSDNPHGDILARLDRELWALALEALEKTLTNQLTGHRLLNSSIERAPWGMSGERIQLLAGQGRKMKLSA